MAQTKSNRLKVLVVDDEIHIADLLQESLKMGGYQVAVAYDGIEALKKVEEIHPHVILLDVQLPGLDGWAVCKRLKADDRTKNTPIIIITAFSQERDRGKSIEVGADAFLIKPIKIENLMSTIQGLLKNHQLQ